MADHFNHRGQLFHPNGTFDLEFGSWGRGDGVFYGVGGVAIGPSGQIAATDRLNHRVQLFHPNGTFDLEFGFGRR